MSQRIPLRPVGSTCNKAGYKTGAFPVYQNTMLLGKIGSTHINLNTLNSKTCRFLYIEFRHIAKNALKNGGFQARNWFKKSGIFIKNIFLKKLSLAKLNKWNE